MLPYGSILPRPSLNTLEQLCRLDKSSSGFRDQLSHVLSGEEYKRWNLALDGKDLVCLADYLDGALDSLDAASSAASECLRELRHMCGFRMVLPTPYILLSSLLDIGRQPVTSAGSGDVYEGTLNGSRVSVKRGRVSSKDGPGKATKALYQEAVVWKHLSHPHIVPFMGVTLEPFQLVSEWMPGGELTEYIKKYPDADRLGLISGIANGLCFLHSRNIVHGNLRTANILVDDVGHARITDFGQATVAQNPGTTWVASDDQGHTARWTAPEILNGQGSYSKEADVFSFAMVMIEVFTGAIPFNNKLPAVATLAIMGGERPSRPTHPALTNQLWMMMQCCWDQDPHLRPKISEVLQVLLAPDPPAWKRLISCPHSMHERISLTTSIFSDHNEVEVIEHLSGDDAQTFIDMVDEVLDSLPQKIHRKCLRSLYRICGRQALLPKSLTIPLCYERIEAPRYRGGFADVWVGECHGRRVAVKVLRVRTTSDLERITKRFCKDIMTWKHLRHPNVLPLLGVTMTENQFGMVSEWVENGNINEFLKAHVDTDRLKLLGEVARGLIHMHDLEIVHGNLKVTNILIDPTGRACITDFALPSIASDRQSLLFSQTVGGTTQWMSPELLDPERFGLKESHPTKESDCYALGMVIYEVLTGQTPFVLGKGPTMIGKVLDGERPARPQGLEGELITGSIWAVVQSCWKPQPGDRPSARAVLLGLEGNSAALVPTSPIVNGDVETDTDCQSDATASESGLSIALCEKDLPDSGATSPTISLGGDKLPDPPRKDSSKDRWVRRLARSARETFRAVSRKLCGL